jgi:hypothetical protein
MLGKRNGILAFAGFAMFMAATRFPGLGSNLHLQDASWAVFFLAGFYLKKHWRRAFPALMATAVAIDCVAIQYYGVSNYCVTVAYWFLVPAYGALWLGGSSLRNQVTNDLRGLVRLAATLIVAVSACFLISNGSFYWLGGRVADRTWNGWASNFTIWYWPFLRIPVAYVAVATFFHVLLSQLRPFAETGGGRSSSG